MAIGSAVPEFAVGDQSSACTGTVAHAEYVCVRETAPLAHMPADMSYEEAAAVSDGAFIALVFLETVDLSGGRDPHLRRFGRDRNSRGSAAKALGADVTAVCGTKNVELMRSLGADEVIDYPKKDFTKNGETYDVVFDAVGKHSFRKARLAGAGRGLPRDRSRFHVTSRRWLWYPRIGDKKAIFPIPTYRRRTSARQELIEAGKYRRVIDRTYPLEDVVEATRYVETHRRPATSSSLWMEFRDEGRSAEQIRPAARRHRAPRTREANARRRRGAGQGPRNLRQHRRVVLGHGPALDRPPDDGDASPQGRATRCRLRGDRGSRGQGRH